MTTFALSRWHWSGVSGSNRCRPDPSETFSKLLELAAVKQDSCFLCSYSQIWCLSMTQIILLQAFQAGKNGKTLEKSVQPPFPPFYNVLQFLSFICSLPPTPQTKIVQVGFGVEEANTCQTQKWVQIGWHSLVRSCSPKSGLFLENTLTLLQVCEPSKCIHLKGEEN